MIDDSTRKAETLNDSKPERHLGLYDNLERFLWLQFIYKTCSTIFDGAVDLDLRNVNSLLRHLRRDLTMVEEILREADDEIQCVSPF
jgi:hypothetical protein